MAVFGLPAVHEDDALRARARRRPTMRGRARTPRLRARRRRPSSSRSGSASGTGEVVTGEARAGARAEPWRAPPRLQAGAEAGEHRRRRRDPREAQRDRSPRAAWRSHRRRWSRRGQRSTRPWSAGSVSGGCSRRSSRRSTTARASCSPILGAAGVGKSRLVQEFLDGLGGPGARGVGPLPALRRGHHLLAALRGRQGRRPGWTTPSRRGRTGAVAGCSRASRDGDLVARAVAGSGRARERRGRERGALRGRPRVRSRPLARRQPLVLVFDDIHWGEPTFLDLVEHLADWRARRPAAARLRRAARAARRAPGRGAAAS